MPSAASSMRAPGHRRRDGSRSALPNGPSANASPRSRVAIRDASLMSAYRLSAAPFRFALGELLAVDRDLHDHGLRVELVGGHDAGTDREREAVGVASGSPLAPCADQSFTSV